MIDLHLHLDGSLTKEDILHLASMQNIEVNPDELQLSVDLHCESLNEYLKCFDIPLKFMQTKEALKYSAYSLTKRLANEGLIYAEIRFAPQLHLQKGLTQAEVVEAAIEGINEGMKECPSIKTQLILCCMRNDNPPEVNYETVDVAKKYLGNGVCAIDLAGAEGLYGTYLFGYLFTHANSLGIPFTIHAGEADGPFSVKLAIEYGAKRIGHGVKTIMEPSVMKMAKEKNIIFEFCPTSNVNTKAISKIKYMPLNDFAEYGLKITINTDNKTVSDTTIMNEYRRLMNKFELSKGDIYNFLHNAVEASFTSQDEKENLYKILDEKFDDWYLKLKVFKDNSTRVLFD